MVPFTPSARRARSVEERYEVDTADRHGRSTGRREHGSDTETECLASGSIDLVGPVPRGGAWSEVEQDLAVAVSAEHG